MSKKTLYCVTDSETSLWDGKTFNIAWKWIDKKGNVYEKESYLAIDVLKVDFPWFKQKMGEYLTYIHKGEVEPTLFSKIQFLFNKQIRKFAKQGHRCIFSAYNAPFDIKKLNETSNELLGKDFFEEELEYLCIWYWWCITCPKNYFAIPSKSGKNIKTSAESVYRFETNDDSFCEAHIAHKDVDIEADILQRVIIRNDLKKEAIPAVKQPWQIVGNPWMKAMKRIGFEKLENSEIEPQNFQMGFF